MNAHGSLIVVVPVYNEAPLLATLLERLSRVASAVALEGVVIVDDGSTDDTAGVVQRGAGGWSFPIRLVRLSRNFGHQNAIIAGLEVAHGWAESSSVEWVGVIDGDLQDRPEHFIDLLAHAESHDVVFAQRASRADGRLVRWLSPLFHRLLSSTARLAIPADAGAFSIMRTPIVDLICQSSDRDPYFPGLRAWVGFRQRGIALPRDARPTGTSKVGLRGLIGLSIRALITYTDLLFNFMVAAGGVIVGLTLMVSIILFGMRVMGWITIPGATTIVVLILLSLGITIFFLGILAHMIKRAAESASRQRAFVVMEIRSLE